MRTPSQIIDTVAAMFGLTREQLISRCRTNRISHARWMAFAAIRAGGLVLHEIGGMFGLDHSTVSHGIAGHVRLLESDAAHRARWLELCKRCGLDVQPAPAPEPLPPEGEYTPDAAALPDIPQTSRVTITVEVTGDNVVVNTI